MNEGTVALIVVLIVFLYMLGGLSFLEGAGPLLLLLLLIVVIVYLVRGNNFRWRWRWRRY